MKRYHYFVPLLCFPCFLAYASVNNGSPVSSFVVLDRGIAKFIADSHALRDGYSHNEREVVNELKNGVVKKREEKLFYVEGRGQKLYKKLLSKDGVLVKDAAFELKKENVPIDEKFFSRFIYSVEGTVSDAGIVFWTYRARPKPNLPEVEKADRILNNLEAVIYVNSESLSITKIVAHLTHPVDYAWPGIAGGQVQRVDVTVEIGDIGGHLAVVRVLAEYKYAARALMWPINGHAEKSVYYLGYKKRS